MTLRTSLFVLLLFTGSCASTESLQWNSSTDELLEFRHEITPGLLQSHLEVIAHDSLMGRDTGSEGLRIAADYLAEQYNRFQFTPPGDEGTYFQHFDLSVSRTDSIRYSLFTLSENDTTLTLSALESADSAGSFFSLVSGPQPLSGSLRLGGFDVNGHGTSKPQAEEDPLSEQGDWILLFEEVPVAAGETAERDLSNRINSVYEQYNPAGILLIPELSADEFDQFMGINPRFSSSGPRPRLAYMNRETAREASAGQTILYIHPVAAAELLGLQNESQLSGFRDDLARETDRAFLAPLNHYLEYTPYFTETITTKNVVAFLEGADPELSGEVVILLAHYDHIGYETGSGGETIIFNGADDNGSGTVALVAAANAFFRASQEGYRPRRSILFLHVSAEEIGLLGSRFYSDHPLFPIEQTVAAFNADMIGRSDPRNTEEGDTDYVYLIGGDIISSKLDETVVRANEMSVNMRLDRYYNDLRDRNQFYRRSDHWNLGRLEVPFVFFFTGVHEDYHRPTDTADKIDYEKLTRITQLIYSTAVKTANLDNRPLVDNEEFIEITRRIAQ